MIKNLILKFIPRKFYVAYVDRKNNRFKKMTTEQVFSEIYEKKIWDTNELKTDDFCSGSGTININTADYITFLCQFIQANNIKDIVEIGCGDFKVMNKVTEIVNPNSYQGTDVVSNLITHNQKAFTRKNLKFICLNAVTDALPDGDCILIRQVLQHLNNDQIANILSKVFKFKYVLITEHIPLKCIMPNKDKIQGPETRLNVNSGVFVEKEPFNMRNVETIFEYREDHKFMNKNIEAILRTSLIKNF